MEPTNPAASRPGYAEESHSLMVTIPVLVLTPMMVVLFAIRTWARQVMNGLALEDWVLLFAFVWLPLVSITVTHH